MKAIIVSIAMFAACSSAFGADVIKNPIKPVASSVIVNPMAKKAATQQEVVATNGISLKNGAGVFTNVVR